MSPTAPPCKQQPGQVQGIMLLLPITMAVMSVSVLSLAMPVLLQHFADTLPPKYLVPVLMILPLLCIVVASPIAGWLADHYGRRRLLIGAMLAYAIVGTLPIYLDDMYSLLISRCGVGICTAIAMTVSTTLISDYFKGTERARWLASQTILASLSAIVIIPLGGMMGSTLGWRGPFYLYAYALPLTLGIYKLTWESNRESDEQHSPEHSQYYDMPWLRIFSLCALTVVAAEMFYGTQSLPEFALAAQVLKYPELYVVLHFLGIPVGALIYRQLTHVNIGLIVGTAFLLIGAGFWCMGATTQALAYSSAMLGSQLGCGMVMAAMLVWTTEHLAYSIRGRGHGLFHAAFTAGQSASAITFAYFTAQLGSYANAFKATGVVALSIAIATLLTCAGLRASRFYFGNKQHSLN